MKKFTKRQITTIIMSCIFAFATILSLIFAISLSSTQKLVCESSGASITILYNGNDISGYSAYGMSYDLEGQRDYASQVGLEAYLFEFQEWFKSSTDGVCERSR